MSPLIPLAGALIGLGVFLLIRQRIPAPPALPAALQRLQAQTRRPGESSAPGLSPWIGRALAARIAGSPLAARIPRQDLAMLGKTETSYLAEKAATLALGLTAPALVWAVTGASLAWPLWLAATLAFAAFCFFAPDIAVRSQAADARQEFRQALIAYLDLVALARAAGAGPAEALETPLQVARGWAFWRMAAALDPTRRGTASAWNSLTDLADEIAVPELTELAVTMRLAGTQGARTLDTLTARAQSLREHALTRALAKAKARTETMTIPMTLAVLGFMVLLGFPAFARMTG